MSYEKFCNSDKGTRALKSDKDYFMIIVKSNNWLKQYWFVMNKLHSYKTQQYIRTESRRKLFKVMLLEEVFFVISSISYIFLLGYSKNRNTHFSLKLLIQLKATWNLWFAMIWWLNYKLKGLFNILFLEIKWKKICHNNVTAIGVKHDKV